VNNHLYSVTVEHLASENAGSNLDETVTFTFLSHENVAEIMNKMQQVAQDEFQETNQTLAFSLLLLSSVVLRNKEHPFFEELLPALIMTKKKIKNHLNHRQLGG
jgi:predicted DNA-binding ArsR family transcriptional regulator